MLGLTSGRYTLSLPKTAENSQTRTDITHQFSQVLPLLINEMWFLQHFVDHNRWYRRMLRRKLDCRRNGFWMILYGDPYCLLSLTLLDQLHHSFQNRLLSKGHAIHLVLMLTI